MGREATTVGAVLDSSSARANSAAVANRSAGAFASARGRLGHALGHGVPHLPQRPGRFQHPPRDHRLRGRGDEGRLARQHLVEHDAEAVDVGAGVNVLVGRGLLRAHVGRGAEG
jgi:hypothetical protein